MKKKCNIDAKVECESNEIYKSKISEIGVNAKYIICSGNNNVANIYNHKLEKLSPIGLKLNNILATLFISDFLLISN